MFVVIFVRKLFRFLLWQFCYMKQNSVLALQTSLLTLRFDCDELRASGTGRVKFGTDRQTAKCVNILCANVVVIHEFNAE